ncbi:unnamed protein product [Oreochromis niloticus]|nr:unnamed protein product [Mustela putorius furo]
MPFGLCNAPATFERLMERVLVNIPRSRCVVYLDDLLVHGGDFDSALSHPSEVFSAIRRAGLQLNPAKCRLLARETTRPCMAVECRYCLRQEERAQEALGVATAQATASGGGWLPLTAQQLKREQEANATLVQVGAWLEVAQRPDWTGVSGQEPEVKAYYSQHNNLETHDGLLYRRWRAPGNRYVLVAMDYFTKWPEAYAVPDQSATTTAERLAEEMFARFGVPAELHSDQGRNFESKVFGEICRRLGVEKTRTTPLHPQSDGLVERFNRTLATQLAILTSRHQRDWDRHLPLVLWSYWTAVQESSQCTPAALMFGWELWTPVDLVFGSPPRAGD